MPPASRGPQARVRRASGLAGRRPGGVPTRRRRRALPPSRPPDRSRARPGRPSSPQRGQTRARSPGRTSGRGGCCFADGPQIGGPGGPRRQEVAESPAETWQALSHGCIPPSHSAICSESLEFVRQQGVRCQWRARHGLRDPRRPEPRPSSSSARVAGDPSRTALSLSNAGRPRDSLRSRRRLCRSPSCSRSSRHYPPRPWRSRSGVQTMFLAAG